MAGLSAAEDASPVKPPTNLPGMIVQGQRQKKSSLTSLSVEEAAGQKKEIPGGFAIRSAEEMKKGRGSNFQDLLGGIPGLTLQSENGVEVSKISIRGSGINADEPLGVDFLLDGVSFNQGDGEAILEDFDVSTLNYAEVFRGANGFKYGARMLGGAVNLVPFTGYTADPYGVDLEGGSYGFMRAQASIAGVLGGLDYYASLSGRYRDGYRNHSRENTELFFYDMGYKLSEHLENQVYLTIDRTDRELPGALTKQQILTDPKQADPDAERLDYTKRWNYIRIADKLSYENAGQKFDASVYYWHRDLLSKDFYDPDDLQDGIQIFHADNVGINLNSSTEGKLFGQRNIFSMGLSPSVETQWDHNFANLNGSRGQTIGRGMELAENVPVYFVNQHYFTDHVSLVTGVQGVYARRQFYDKFNDTESGDQSASLNYYGLNPKFGLLYELDKDNQIFANFSHSFQPPSFDNMLEFDGGLGSSFELTPLKAQRSWTLETGTRGERGRFEWEFAVYRSWLRNELQNLYDAEGNDRGDVNVPRSYHQGIEAGLEVELWNSQAVKEKDGQRVTLNQTYTLNDFHYDGDPVYRDNRIGSVPIHLYEMELMYQSPCGFYAGPNVKCNLTSYPVDQQNTLSAGAYTLLGFKAGYAFKGGASIFFEASNLTDKRYAASVDPIPDARNPSDPQIFHPGDGRSFYTGVRWNW
jgi:iron complex outermembrane receptor protein